MMINVVANTAIIANNTINLFNMLTLLRCWLHVLSSMWPVVRMKVYDKTAEYDSLVLRPSITANVVEGLAGKTPM